MMDLYYDPTWRTANPYTSALHDKICPSPDTQSWRILYALNNGVWHCLTRGIFGNPDGYFLSWGSDKSVLMDLLSIKNEDWLVKYNLSEIVTHHIDTSSIPLEAWQETQP